MNRAEHLQWCKTRALEYVAAGNNTDALASLLSDLGKHPETARSLNAISTLGMGLMMTGALSTADQMTKFINGCN